MRIEKGEDCGAVLPAFKCNLAGNKILGRANTLKLRRLNVNEDFEGIYDALQSYRGIAENDIICVENEIPEYAYFGDLNARLAIRYGASAAIINGNTRDLAATRQLNFPVYCRGYNSQDVRRRATTEYINKPINFGLHTINPGDLIFIDDVSIVILHKKYEEEILNRIMHIIENENNITVDIMNDKDIMDICKTRGNF
jgi:regulator of RNase E activity RraA